MVDEGQRRYIEITLQELPMVEWDRFVNVGWNWAIYGWIARSDSNKDFVVVEFAFDGEGANVWFVTSSAGYTDEIATRLGITENHGKCQNVADTFPSLSRVSWATTR